MTLRAHRLTTGASGTYDKHAVEAVYTLLAQILPGPSVPRPACAGVQGGLWDDIRDCPAGETAEDPHDRAQRLLAAQAICRGCPAIEACEARRLADPKLPGGMWAGQLYRAGQSEPSPIVCIICKTGLSESRHRQGATTCGDPECARRADAEREARRKRSRRQVAPLAPCPRCGTPVDEDRRRTYCTRECARLTNVDRQRAARAEVRRASRTTTTEVAA